MSKVLSFEAACKVTGDDPTKLPIVDHLPEIQAKKALAGHILDIINKGTNMAMKFKPDFSNPKQYKYTCWLWYDPSLGRFVYTHTDYALTRTDLGARFWFKDDKTAREFFEQNSDLVNDLHRQE